MMRVTRPFPALAGLIALVAVGACGARTPAPGPAPAPDRAPAPDATPAAQAGSGNEDEIEALWRARLDSARMSFTEADVRFMRGMIHHHAQALEMTRLVADRTASASIRTLAARITNSQRDEIATMQRWLEDRGLATAEIHPTGHHGAMHMPGMLSPAQMQELAAARGPAFDRLFLEYMIQHHRGAVVMVHELFATDGAAQDEAAFKFASDVQVDQSTEIARMERMLAAMAAGPGG